MTPNQIISFIRKTFNEPSEFIPLHDPRFIGNEKKYLNDCIDSNFVSSVGEYVGKFEKSCAEYTGAKYAVAAMNGTAALHIALMLSGVKRDEEILTQPLTFIATANAISYTGAHPVFIDVDKETMGLSPSKLEEYLINHAIIREDGYSYNKTTGNRFGACVPMHTFGHPVRLDEIIDICNKYNIPCIEDAAESLGSYYKGSHTGTKGKFGILSFNGNKIVTCGGGGMILTNDEALAKKAKHITTQAKVPHSWEFVHDEIGYNYRLTNVSAALGCAQMESMDFFIGEKRKLATKYKEFFAGSEYTFFEEPENCKSNYWLNVILTKDKNTRDEFLKITNENGVMTRPAWELMPQLRMFQHCECAPIPNAEWLADRIVNIPSSVIIPGYRKKADSK